MDALLKELASWIRDFGHGPAGFVVLAMILLAGVLAWVIPRCLPEMYKTKKDHELALRELEAKTKEVDLEIMKKVEKLGGRAFEIKPPDQTGKKGSEQ